MSTTTYINPNNQQRQHQAPLPRSSSSRRQQSSSRDRRGSGGYGGNNYNNRNYGGNDYYNNRNYGGNDYYNNRSYGGNDYNSRYRNRNRNNNNNYYNNRRDTSNYRRDMSNNRRDTNNYQRTGTSYDNNRRRPSPYYHRRKTFYNRNYRQTQRYYDNNNRGNYDNNNNRGNHDNNNRANYNRFNGRGRRRRRSQSRQQQEDLRNPSSPITFTLPSDFNIATAAPVNALPQRENSAANTTHPFVVNQTYENQNQNEQQQQLPRQQNGQQLQKATSSHRRRQRRFQQDQYHRHNQNEVMDNNRYDENNNDNDNNNEPPLSTNTHTKKNKENNKNTKRIPSYLQPHRIIQWFENNAKTSFNGRGNQTYILATASLYDKWVRNHYDTQLWKEYFRLGTKENQWAKEIVQRTSTRDNHTKNTQFVQKKLKQLETELAQIHAGIYAFQIELTDYSMQTSVDKIVQTTAERTTDMVVERMNQASTNASTTNAPTKISPRDVGDRLEKIILNYIRIHTQHVKDMIQNKMRFAIFELKEFNAYQDFKQIASPLQLNMDMNLKPKMKLWSIKNQNRRTAEQRVLHNLPPKFLSNIDVSFKIDEKVLPRDESQKTYAEMRKISATCRTDAMNLYVKTITREEELLKNEIDQLMEYFRKKPTITTTTTAATTNLNITRDNEALNIIINNDETMEEGNQEEIIPIPNQLTGTITANQEESAQAAYISYHELRLKRLNLEAEQSIYFLEVQRVEGDNNNQEEQTTIAPTLFRQLGEDFTVRP